MRELGVFSITGKGLNLKGLQEVTSKAWGYC